MLFDRSNWPQHRPWLIACLLVMAAALLWFGVASLDSAQWPGGSSLPGFTFGVAGGLIIVFEFLLWLRKKVRVWHLGSAQTWLRAHIWLGLLCVPLLILHSGLRLGGTLSTVLMVLLLIVVASGIWGLVLQNLLPTRMNETMSAGSASSLLESPGEQLLAEAEQRMSATLAGVPIPDAEPLAAFYREIVVPYLRDGNAGDSPLARASKATVLFQNFKVQVPSASHRIVDALESLCQQRRQWDRQARMHFWLHNWLWVHFPLSVALLVLMTAHVLVALKFW